MRRHGLVFKGLVLALVLFPAMDLPGQQWMRIATPPNISILYDVIVLPNGVVAVDAIPGVLVTSDNGATWEMTLETNNVLRMTGTDNLFALGGLGGPFIYASDEAGTVWTNIATDSIQRPYVLRFAQRSESEFFALGTLFGGGSPMLYRTTNGGSDWHPLASAPYFTSLLAGPGEELYGVHGTDGFYRSTDNGLSWVQSNSGITTTWFSSIAARGQDTLFLPSSNGIFYRSTDRGLSWQSITSSFGNTSFLVSLRVSTTGALYVADNTGTQSRINVSLDHGVTWNTVGDPIPTPNGNLQSIAVTPRNTIVAKVPYDYLYTNDSTFVTTGILSAEIPLILGLDQNFPNPFNPSTTIRFDLDRRSHVRLRVFDVLGREIGELANDTRDPGTYTILFQPEGLSSGVYLYRLETEDGTISRKMILQK